MDALGVTVFQVSEIWGKNRLVTARKLQGISPMSLDDAEILQEILKIDDEDFGSYFFA